MNIRFKAFSLIELLVVISIIALLIGIVVPALMASKSKSKQIICQSNIRQLLLADIAYADQNSGYYAPAALDFLDPNKETRNRHRWYGIRDNINSPFDLSKGPLSPYLRGSGLKCPTKVDFIHLAPSEPEYDEGSGGYGYNMIYIGSKIWKDGQKAQSCKVTAKTSDVRFPASTLMFADTAMAKMPGFYIEHSFAEPRYFVLNGKPFVSRARLVKLHYLTVDRPPAAQPRWGPNPSIHFRHRSLANIGWTDGHVSSEKMGRYDGLNNDGLRPADMELGWFEPMDNTLFDLK